MVTGVHTARKLTESLLPWSLLTRSVLSVQFLILFLGSLIHHQRKFPQRHYDNSSLLARSIIFASLSLLLLFYPRARARLA